MNEQSPAASVDRFFSASLAETDPDLAAALGHELDRQRDGIELIASENLVSAAVLEAQGSVLTNKYAEGYPGRRYYGGCVYVDVAEELAIARAKQLFQCAFANVQPHSGAQANQAVFLALCKPGDTVLGMSLAAGGHLTHGAAPWVRWPPAARLMPRTQSPALSRPRNTAWFACAPECGCTLAKAQENSFFARSIASCSATSTNSQPP